jgi:hypothetical protein
MSKKKLKELIELLVEEQTNYSVGSLYLFKNKVLGMVIREMIVSGRKIGSDTEFWSLIHDSVSQVKTIIDGVLKDVAMQTPNQEKLNWEEYMELYRSFDRLLQQEMKGKGLSSPAEMLALISDSAGKIRSDLDLTYSLIERDISTIPYPIFFAKYNTFGN